MKIYKSTGTGILWRSHYGWQDDNTKCVKAGSNTETVSVNNIPVLNKITVYPNPATNTIFLKGLDDKNHVSVYNILGGMLLDFEDVADNMPLDISTLPKGIYLVKVEGKNKEIFISKITVLD